MGRTEKPYRGWPMEGGVARRYATLRSSHDQLALYRRQAADLTSGLKDRAEILEVAPGPGFLAIEMARPGRFRVAGLDVSATFVELARAAAAEAGVDVEFGVGDVADMPFEAGSFDLVVTQAAFKNFSRPARALEEMHRVLRPGGVAVIQDMNGDTTIREISKEVNRMGVGRASAPVTKAILVGLRRRAYSRSQFEQLVADSPFGTGEITTEGIGLEIRMTRQPVAGAVGPRS
jgi:ubiquinone/menaquinone biosynthesis C-methylase UbiE